MLAMAAEANHNRILERTGMLPPKVEDREKPQFPPASAARTTGPYRYPTSPHSVRAGAKTANPGFPQTRRFFPNSILQHLAAPLMNFVSNASQNGDDARTTISSPTTACSLSAWIVHELLT
jgi:hypothetical protein